MYRVAKGGAITINSFLSNEDRNIAREHMLKTASTNMREAAKIGLQSLYADPNEVLEKYKDFDIVKEMQARKGAKLLWVRARAIDADTVNANGDYFSKAELLKEAEVKGEKIPAYKTFEGVPIYTNHKNDDIEQAKGMVVYAEWDDKENCVYCTFFVDEEAYPDIARNIRTGVIHDVSMGCSVSYGICSKCENKAYYEKDYCDCLKKFKGKTEPSSGKKVYEKNYDLKFIELSCVGDGAFETCEIQEIYDVDDILDAARDLERKANELTCNIILAHQGAPVKNRAEYEECLRTAQSTAQIAVKLAQSAGTLVGGPLLAGEGANQNSTVNAVLQALGIDPRSGLNVLDLINLSLNFLEVSVLNLFARKDNVDLTHVSKISKAMADLQSTMQDMIDEGVDVGQGRPAPINQQQIQQAGQQRPTAPASFSNYTLDDSGVGRIMDFSNQSSESSAIGGGVALASTNANFVWASKTGSREVYASVSNSKQQNSIEKFVKNIYEFKNVLDNSKEIQNSIDNVVRVANERNKQVKTNTPKNNEVEGNQMDHFAKIASEQRKKLSAAVTIDFKVEDNSGNRVVLSTDGSITGYVKGVKTEWEPILNENQLSLMDNGQGTRVAAELLKDFTSFTKTHPYKEPRIKTDIFEEELSSYRQKSYDSLGDGLSKDHKNTTDETRQESLEKHRKNDENFGNEFYSKSLVDSKLENAKLYSQRVKDEEVKRTLTELVNDANKGYPSESREVMLNEYRSMGTAKPHLVMSKTLNALAKAVVTAMETPTQIMRVAQTLVDEPMLPEMIGTAKEGEPYREELTEKNEFFNKEVAPETGVAAILKQLAAEITSEVTAADLANALQVAVEEGEITKEGVTRLAELLMGSVSVPEEGLDVEAPTSKNEELRAALMSAVEEDDDLISKEDLRAAISGLAMSSKDTMATPGEVTDVIDSMPQEELMASIDRAKTKTATDARLRARARREFWGVKTASSKDLKSNVSGWLADYSINFGISSRAITAAAKRLCSDFDLAERLVSKAVQVSDQAKTAGMTVTQDKSENVRFVCRVEDLDVNPTDADFEESFKQKAISVLQSNGFNVDPSTFTFTDLNISAFGDVTASISSRVSRSFKVDGNGSAEESGAELVEDVMEMDDEVPVVMTEAAKFARVQRRNEILARYAQVMGGPGGVPGAPAGAAADPMGETPTDYGAEPGVSGLTTGVDTEMNEAADTDTNVPGEEHPWGTICPICGSDNTNIAEANAECQDCGTTYTIEQSIKVVSKGSKGKAIEELPEENMTDMSGLGETTAPAAVPPAAETPGMAPMANFKSMFRVATTVDADVYLRTAMDDFEKTAEKKLPIGMVCPKCGNREAHKVKNNTFCYRCNTFAKTEIRTSKKNPSKLDVSITWID